MIAVNVLSLPGNCWHNIFNEKSIRLCRLVVQKKRGKLQKEMCFWTNFEETFFLRSFPFADFFFGSFRFYYGFSFVSF